MKKITLFLIFFQPLLGKTSFLLLQKKQIEKLNDKLQQKRESNPLIKRLHQELQTLTKKRTQLKNTLEKKTGISELQNKITDTITELEQAKSLGKTTDITRLTNKLNLLKNQLKTKEKSISSSFKSQIEPLDKQIKNKTIDLRKTEKKAFQDIHKQIGQAEAAIIQSLR